jgi:hypothetical protein
MAGNDSLMYVEFLSLAQTTFSLRDLSPPTIAGFGAPSAAWRAGGIDAVDVSASDNVGIAALVVRSGSREVGSSTTPCYDAATNVDLRPCAGANTRLAGQILRDTFAEGTHSFAVEARDPAGLTTSRGFHPAHRPDAARRSAGPAPRANGRVAQR